jgi:hypothetical protein
VNSATSVSRRSSSKWFSWAAPHGCVRAASKRFTTLGPGRAVAHAWPCHLRNRSWIRPLLAHERDRYAGRLAHQREEEGAMGLTVGRRRALAVRKRPGRAPNRASARRQGVERGARRQVDHRAAKALRATPICQQEVRFTGEPLHDMLAARPREHFAAAWQQGQQDRWGFRGGPPVGPCLMNNGAAPPPAASGAGRAITGGCSTEAWPHFSRALIRSDSGLLARRTADG